MNSEKKYYLGLDMGTSSVGWAVTDENYNICRKKGKDMWGIREFDEAETAVERRTHRISRRMRQRQVARIGLLKEYFAEEIDKVDPNFYQRLENSKYYFEDKNLVVRTKNGIFNDPNYTDADYFKEYKTIFHLRKELIESDKPHDVRLVFLALLNMFKHRGHFLNVSLGDEVRERTIKTVYNELADRVNFILGLNLGSDVDYSIMKNVLSSKDESRTKKSEYLLDLLGLNKKSKDDKIKVDIVKGLCGLKINIKSIFKDVVDFDDDNKLSLCFADFKYEEDSLEVLEIIGENNFEIISLMKEIYDIASLAGILKDYEYLSVARVASYDKHCEDLLKLKSVVKKYCTNEVYNDIFRNDSDGSYSAYVNSCNSGKRYRRSMKKRQREELYAIIKKLLAKMNPEDDDVKYIRQEIENENFLPKQLTQDNGVIPNQVHVKEMKKILNNAEKYLSFLSVVDESGLTVKERIIRIFSFQIPYYVGPVSNRSEKYGGNGWVIRKEEGKVLPWNIDTKIDIKATSEKFISRMVRKCTYITGERVLPKESLLYESFSILNEINNIRIDGVKISVEVKKKMYFDLFTKGKKVTKKKICEYLVSCGVLEIDDVSLVSGIDHIINNTLSTFAKFESVLGNRIQKDSYRKMIEQIVFWKTIYSDSKQIVRELIIENYSDMLNEVEIKRIVGYKFKDWGNLSKSFLMLNGCSKETGEELSIIRRMWETNDNLMEILQEDTYTYKEELDNFHKDAYKALSDIEAEDLNEMYFSAPVKRMIWQTILIIKEIEVIMGCVPDKVFIEMTREKGEKVRTKSRKDKFLELYKNIKDEECDWKKVIEDADADGKLRSKKMYLYLTQKGRCMYSGETIDLDNLFNDNLYDIDHIYPRHFTKDDNIDNNLVLVKKEINSHKSDSYPLEDNIYKSQFSNWNELFREGLITEEKLHRLTSRNPLSDEQKADFIARQMVETSQGTKGVATLLKSVLPDSKIVYAKATNVSEFRHQRDIVKSRLVNDYHHAHDAYLNIVVGNAYLVKFTENPRNFINKEYNMEHEEYHYNLSRMFDWDIRRGNEVAWISSKNEDSDKEAGTIVTVKNMLSKNTPLLTRLCYEGHGGIANQTLFSAKKAKGNGYIPLKAKNEKMQDVTKYGGFSSVTTAYFFLVEHENKGKRIRTLETVPVMYSRKFEKDDMALKEYCEDVLKLKNPVIKVKKIKLHSLVKRNGYYMYITGKTNNRITTRNAVQLCLKPDEIKYIKKLENKQGTVGLEEVAGIEQNIKIYNVLCEKHNKSIFAKRPNPVGDKLISDKNKFMKLSLEKQVEVLLQILRLTIIGKTSADLRLMGESKETGVMFISKKVSDAEEFILINQSVTGLYENEVDLMKI